MGIVSSRPDEGAVLYLRDQTRLSISSLVVTNSRRQTVLQITQNAFPASRVTANRDMGDQSVVEYIQDPEPVQGAPQPQFLLKINNDEELTFTYTFVIRPQQALQAGNDNAQQAVDTVINGLTYVSASTPKEVENLVTLEFHADPNLHKNANVQLVGDYSTTNGESITFTWSWKWRPPKAQEDRGGGWRNCCSFVEYDQRAHRLNTLATFSFWVHNAYTLSTPNSPSPMFTLSAPPRIRMPSSQSVESRRSVMNPSDYEDQPSPVIETGADTLAPPQMFGSEPKPQSYPPPPVQPPPPPPRPEAPKVDVTCQRPGEDLTAQEDGPLFRATMKALEQKTSMMRTRMKKVLKRAQEAHESQIACNDAMSALIEALRDASASNANAVQPAMDHYFTKIAAEILMYEKRNARNIRESIIDPISKVYEQDIKKAESKKKEFEDESRDYYQYLGRYLGQKQDSKESRKAESDAKYQSKRKMFELKRFDYGCFMQDLHGGRKEQEVLSWLTKYADSQTNGFLTTAKKVEDLKPRLEALSTEVEEADKAFQYTRTEREEKRRTIEMSTATFQAQNADAVAALSRATTAKPDNKNSYISDSDLARSNSRHRNGTKQNNLYVSSATTDGSRTPNSQASDPLNTSPQRQQNGNANKFKGIRDLEERDRAGDSNNNGTERKEGLLWALSKPGSHVDPKGLNKTAWHKYVTSTFAGAGGEEGFNGGNLFWIVLDGGKLSEYSNWKDQLDLHMEPIDLRLATVREARNADRRFTFEVITPQFTRVYQAPSAEEMSSWISAIGNALQSAMEGRSLPSRGKEKSSSTTGSGAGGIVRGVGRDIGSILTGKSTGSSNHSHSQSVSAQQKSDMFRRTTVAGRPTHSYSTNSQNRSTSNQSSPGSGEPDRLLQSLRDLDTANNLCADCNSAVKTEWVSINLGVILCIECSGIHRSLGTHVSKIRSLTLDTQSFTPDIVALLKLVGNRVSNSVYEATLAVENNTKPMPNASRDQRLKFITAKYVDRAYITPLAIAHPNLANADDLLVMSVKRQDISGVIHALALGCSKDASDRSRGTRAVFLALAASDPAPPSGLMGPPASPTKKPAGHERVGTGSESSGYATATSSVSSKREERVAFPIAEILVLNGAEVPSSGPSFPLGPSARIWLDLKRSRDASRAQPLDHSVSVGGTGSSYGSAFGVGGAMSEKDRAKEARLQKRVSAGGRLVGLGRSVGN